MNDFFAALVLEIDVDVGRLASLGGNEALEQEIGTVGVDFGHAEAEADGGIGGRATALAEDALRARETHDVVDGEEVGCVLQLGDQTELMLEIGAHLVRNALRVASGGAVISQVSERILGVVETFNQLVGIFVTQLVE